jgi:glycosyltransferase involved in cell wall biosynthesis
MTKISVIIPCYNSDKFVLETIRSVQKQTCSDWEIIAINDGSVDQTLEILTEIVDDRLKIFSYENAGLSVARNRGLALSTGEFIAFLDSDDLWTSDMLEQQLAALQKHPEANVSYCWTSYIDSEGNFLRDGPQIIFEGYIYLQLLDSHFLNVGSLLIRRKAIESAGEFDSRLTYGEDLDYWLRLSLHSRFVLVPKYQFFYRKWPGSKTGSVNESLLKKHEKSWLLIVEKAVQLAPRYLKHQCQARLNLRLADFYIRHFRHCQSDSDWLNLAGQRIRKAILLEPKLLLQTRTWRRIGKWLWKRVRSRTSVRI